jgi:hypothetical protein
MWVTRVIGDCPGCAGNNCYGNVSVSGNQVLRGCKHCQYRTNVFLPAIRKKVIYLDQFFFSHAFRGIDPRFSTAVDRVKRMTHLQLLVSPYSSVHEDETHQWRGYNDKTKADLMEFIRSTSRGIEFERAYRVERTQVLKAFKAFLAGAPSEYALDVRDAIHGKLDQWDGYFRVDVGQYTRDIELKRRLKTQAVQDLVSLFDQWQHSNESFDQDVAVEIRDADKIYLQTYWEMAARVANGDLNAIIDSPIAATVVEQMLQLVPGQIAGTDRLNRCAEFFQSDHFAQVPNEWISAHIFATLKAMVRRGSYSNREDARNRLSGVFDDISHISMYAPYCDAFVMDTPMAELVRQPTVKLEQRYGVKVFSLRNGDALLAWLDQLETGITDEHRDAIAAAYP